MNRMNSAKYLMAYLIPLTAILGLVLGGGWAYATLIFAFGFIPVVEHIFPGKQTNLEADQQEAYLTNKLFDWLLYLNVPIVYSTVALFIYQLNTLPMSTSELVGHVLAVGIVLGACGINVGHELGHRNNKREQFLAKALLLPSLYQHFFIEHNRGHHKNVATPLDPASARKGEFLYAFWLRSLYGSYINAWQLEGDKIRKQQGTYWSWDNLMIRFTIVQVIYVSSVFLLTPTWQRGLLVIVAGLVGALLLETINYIEHYGLQRKKLSNGRYERVQAHHSWNANYPLGRIILYELTRHSDHHFLANKKYQILDHHDQAPQLPLGYPGSMLLAMVPPLWFMVMDRKLEQENSRMASGFSTAQ